MIDEVTHIIQNINQNKIDKLILNLTNSIISAATIAIGKSDRPAYHKIVPWWNEKYKTATKNIKKALNH